MCSPLLWMDSRPPATAQGRQFFLKELTMFQEYAIVNVHGVGFEFTIQTQIGLDYENVIWENPDNDRKV